MLAKNILSVTEARKNIFTLVEKVEKNKTSFILTERGRAKAALIPIDMFDRKMANAGEAKKRFSFSHGRIVTGFTAPVWLVQDGCHNGYQRTFLDAWEEERAYARSILYVKLVEEFGFAPKQIEIGYHVELLAPEGKRHMEIDLIVTNEEGQPIMVCIIMPLKSTVKEQENTAELLYALVDALGMNAKLSWLVGFSYGCKGKTKESKAFVIHYQKYPNFTCWQKEGRKKSEKLAF